MNLWIQLGPIKNVVYHPLPHLNFIPIPHQKYIFFLFQKCALKKCRTVIPKACDCLWCHSMAINMKYYCIDSSIPSCRKHDVHCHPSPRHSGLQISEIKKMGPPHPIFQTKRMINNLFFYEALWKSIHLTMHNHEFSTRIFHFIHCTHDGFKISVG